MSGADLTGVTEIMNRATERGRLASHCTNDSGLPDVGISLGLGEGRMLYAGEAPGCKGMALILYYRSSRAVIAESCSPSEAHQLMAILSHLLNGSDAPDTDPLDIPAVMAARKRYRDAHRKTYRPKPGEFSERTIGELSMAERALINAVAGPGFTSWTAELEAHERAQQHEASA